MLIAAAIFAGCGSDSSSNAAATEESSAPLTKKQFVKEAEEACQQGMKRKDEAVSAALEKVSTPEKNAPTAEDTAKVVEEGVLPAYREIVDQLSQLGVPTADKAQVEEMIGKFEAALQAVEADPVKATKSNPFAAADKAAEAYGIERCVL